MHELGIVFEIKKQVEKTAAENELRLQDIAKVVVEVGEASSVVPSYLKECWPAAIEVTTASSHSRLLLYNKKGADCTSTPSLFVFIIFR